jgi:hypothetical protein
MAKSKRGLWFKFGRFITGLTIACFFLPFFGVSCQGMELVTITGADMVGGCTPGGMLGDAENQAKGMGGGMGHDSMSSKSEMKVDKAPREPLAIVALLAALAVFGLSWVRTRKAMLGAVVLSVVSLGAIAGLYIKVNGDMTSKVDEMNELKHKKSHADSPDAELGESMGKEMMKDVNIDAGSRYGLFATCLLLIGGAALCGMALKEPEGAELQDNVKPAVG